MPQIKTFCRIKPTEEYYPEFEVSRDTLYLRVPEVLRDLPSVNKSRGAMISHEFHFNYIFNNTSTQEEVFDVAAKDIVEGFLNGYNGTIFAYGQTGTGKTFTVEGSPKQYSQRGLEPRALSMIYKELEQRQNEDISVHVSYLEIYQEIGYDLLSPGARTQSLVTPLPRVSVLEGSSGVWFVRNLSVHNAASEEVAQHLLLQGQANRRVAATTVHDRSSRSHAVFTVQLSAKQPDSDVIIKSKLHLVDLAGSERVAKTGVEGHQLNEAKSINLSLHFLETVIIALQGSSSSSRNGSAVSRSAADLQDGLKDSNVQRPYTSDGGRHFVPYRNSLLTMVLRDSLGGNCLTAMIATLSLEIENLGESISTCRFAGRVACIANSVSRNEEVDERTLIKKLRKRVAELETELACVRVARESSSLNIDEMNAKLTDEDKILCSKVVQRYILGELVDPVTAGITSPYKFRECLKLLKRIIIDGKVAIPTQNMEALESQKNGYHSEAHGSNSKKQTPSKTPPDILKVHGDTNLHREKAVDFPITNAWETPAVEPKPVRKPIHRPKPRDIPVVDDAIYHTDNEDSRLPTGESHQTSSSDPIRQHRQERSLAAVLTAKRKKYKSPFEQRREKEIKKLNTRVERMQQEQIEKEGELVEMKLGLAGQELSLIEEQIRNKLDVTKEQVADQHAYVAQLQTTEADPKLIEQEQLVEQQLRKRQQKFDKKLEEIDEKKTQLEQHSEEFAAELQNVPKPSLKEQFGKYRKKDGSLNTRQVFEMLKTQEKRQEKVHNEIDHERAWVYSKHLEMREAATRQKLQQFKEMLRMSKSAGVKGQYGAGEREDKVPVTAPANYFGQHSPEQKEDNKPQTRQTHISQDANVPMTRQTNRSHDTETPATRQTNRTHFTTVNYDDLPVTRETVRTEYTGSVYDHIPNTRQTTHTDLSNGGLDFESVPGTSQTNFTAGNEDTPIARPTSSKSIRSVPDSDFYAARRQEKDPTVRWESSYSRPSTSCSNRLPDDPFSHANGNVGMTDDFKSTSRKSERKLDYEPDVLNLNNGYGSEQEMQDTMMPSEYVYGMGTRDKFDGRKMGLTSKTFDVALASMLDKENQNVYFEQEDYNQYARTPFNHTPKTTYNSPYRESVNSPPKSQLRPRGRSRERKTLSREQQMWNLSDDDEALDRVYGRHNESKRQSRERQSRERSKSQDRYKQEESALDLWASRQTKWGPEAKHTSIYSKLGLQTPEKKVRKTKKKTRGKRTLEQNLSEYDKKTLASSDAKLLIEEQKVTKVTAVPEVEAEDAFMSKVQQQKDRVSKIRQARTSAEIIQRAWRKYLARKKKR